jgi:hypothetical protein
LSVDGMTPVGPNLSHWPGNRTPTVWKADLSTGIALRFARASAAEQRSFLAGVEVVLNDHYDTDGFGSLLAVLRPEVAFAHEELLLAAATVGDFGIWVSPRAFCVERAVVRLAAADSPAAREFVGIDDPAALCLARYRWLMEHGDELLRQPERFARLSADEAARITGELAAGAAGAVQRLAYPSLGFAVLTTDGPRHRMTLNTLSGAHRVLHVDRRTDGTRYRYHDRTESWFELVTTMAMPRGDLRPVAERLDGLEGEHDGARWCADPPTEPIPELYFGVPAAQEYGQITRILVPSRLRPERVQEALATHFAAVR